MRLLNQFQRLAAAALGVSLTLVLSATTFAAPIIMGPGLVDDSNADDGDRLNVAAANTQVLSGDYTVSSFYFGGTSASGTVVPFLAEATGADEYEVLWVGDPVATANGIVTASPESPVNIASPTNVFASFYTAGGGRVAYNDGAGNTDHDSTFSPPTTGSTVNGFSNPNLARTYAFAVAVSQDAPGTKTLGPGTGTSTTGADSGERLNVDEAYGRLFDPGTYDVTDFSFDGTSAAGTVTPFLARLTSDNNYEIVWLGDDVGSANGLVSVDPSGSFSVTTQERLFPGFFTESGGRVAYVSGNNDVFGVTDHDNAFTAPNSAGDAVGGFSNPNLLRRYSFNITVSQAVPEPTTLSLAGLGAMLLCLRRQRRQRAITIRS